MAGSIRVGVEAVRGGGRTADAVLLLGTRVSMYLNFGRAPMMHPDCALVQVDIDAAEIGRNRDVSLGVHGDARSFCETALEIVEREDLRFAVDGWIEKRRAELADATDVEVAVSGVPGFDRTLVTTQLVAFATVDLEVRLGNFFLIGDDEIDEQQKHHVDHGRHRHINGVCRACFLS